MLRPLSLAHLSARPPAPDPWCVTYEYCGLHNQPKEPPFKNGKAIAILFSRKRICINYLIYYN